MGVYKINRYSLTDEKEAYLYKIGTKCGSTHYNKGIEMAQMYNERPSYTTIHKGRNMRPNTQKLFKCDVNYQSLTPDQKWTLIKGPLLSV